MIFGIEQKKGDPAHLNGKITVYAKIDIDPSELVSVKHPVSSMVHNNLLVAQGNFRDQNSLLDFLKSEMGLSVSEGFDHGIEEFVEGMDGLEGALDPEKLKERLENLSEFEEFIPTPAKVVPFHSELEILGQEGDVFCVGIFKNVGNAVLSVNALPILYQARYKEQQVQNVRNEIEQLISQIERNETIVDSFVSSGADIEEKLVKNFIPNMLYSRMEPKSFQKATQQFRSFMSGYRFKDDVDTIIDIIGRNTENMSQEDYKLLELYAKKIASVKNEDFGAAENYNREIQKHKNGDV